MPRQIITGGIFGGVFNEQSARERVGPFGVLNAQSQKNYTDALATGAFVIAGGAVTIRAQRVIPAATGAVVVAGQAAGIKATRTIPLSLRAIAIAGGAGGVLATRIIPCASAPVAVGAGALTILATRVIVLGGGAVIVAGQDATAAVGRAIQLATGAFQVAGAAARIIVARVIALGTLEIIVEGGDATFPVRVQPHLNPLWTVEAPARAWLQRAPARPWALLAPARAWQILSPKWRGGPVIEFPEKIPDEQLVAAIDFTDRIGDDRTIASATSEASIRFGKDTAFADLLDGDPTVITPAGKIVTQAIKGGRVGVQYMLRIVATLSDDQIIEEEGLIRVVEFRS